MEYETIGVLAALGGIGGFSGTMYRELTKLRKRLKMQQKMIWRVAEELPDDKAREVLETFWDLLEEEGEI